VKVSSSEYLLLAVIAEVAVRAVTLPAAIQVVHVFAGFVQIVFDRFSNYRR